MRHTLAVLVNNKPGVLTRIAGLFSRRGFNIHSLAVGPTSDPSVSRITIVVKGDMSVVEQVEKQLSKLIDVLKISEIEKEESVERELLLIKVKSNSNTRSEIIQLVDIFRGQIVDVGPHSMIIELTGDQKKVEAIIELMQQFGIQELVRTGQIALNRGEEKVETKNE